jgi:hypothetical protein
VIPSKYCDRAALTVNKAPQNMATLGLLTRSTVSYVQMINMVLAAVLIRTSSAEESTASKTAQSRGQRAVSVLQKHIASNAGDGLISACSTT